MKVYELLNLNQGGCVEVISIHKLPYEYKNHRYSKTYFNECREDELFKSRRYYAIKNRTIDHFNVIGGGYDKMELVIYLKEKEDA